VNNSNITLCKPRKKFQEWRKLAYNRGWLIKDHFLSARVSTLEMSFGLLCMLFSEKK